MKTKRALVLIALPLIGILACNLPAGGASDLAATITAQALTIQAVTDTPTISASSTPSRLEVSVSSDTNCRTGPTVYFDLVLTMKPGDSAPVEGKDTADNYWIIDTPDGGTCWLWGKYATVNGDTSGLPEVPPPSGSQAQAKPTKTPKPSGPTATAGTPSKPFKPVPVTLIANLAPAAPTNFAGTRNSCDGALASDGVTPIWVESVTLNWQDNATNETGYRVYKNNSAISTIPADSTSFHITMRYNQGTGGPLYTNFGVEAYNSFGKSSRPTWDVPNCP